MRAIRRLADTPLIGRPRDADLGQGVRSLVVRQHCLLHQIEQDVVLVLRIVHVRQLMEGQIDEMNDDRDNE